MSISSRVLTLAAILLCSPAWAAPGNTAWSSTYQPGGEPAVSLMATAGAIAYAAISGPYLGSPGSNADIHLRAFDIPTGALLWENVWEASGRFLDDTVTDIAASNGRVFITGQAGSNSEGFNRWVVRAYAGSSGRVLWEDRCATGGSAALSVVATSQWVYVAGTCNPGANPSIVRAFAAATGKLRWEIKIPGMLQPFAIALSKDRLVVTGIDGSESLVLRAYGINRGNFLWQRRPAVPQGVLARSALLAGNASLAYLAWSGEDADGAAASDIVAYETGTGRLRWQSSPGDKITGLALAQGWLYAAEAGGESMVSAYDAGSGLRLWQDHPGTPAAPFRASAVAVGGNQVFVAGSAFHPLHESATNFLVRAYTMQGKLLWADDVPTQALYPANVEGVGWSDGFTVTSGTSGYLEPPYGSTFWQVQGYSTPAIARASFDDP